MGNRVERFEDLIAWQKARLLRANVGQVTREAVFRRDPSMADQMRRAARSIMANIAEGFEKHSRPEFHRFLTIAQGSCGELRSDLYAALDDGLIDRGRFDNIYSMCSEVSRIIAGLRASVRRRTIA
ncbi:MAG TPA: four helix bundle protein [Phycisphaerales bacterium]|mgnify:CR=1 FL=1|nr:four helix bundle protein [Phycisphaerales bacterium]